MARISSDLLACAAAALLLLAGCASPPDPAVTALHAPVRQDAARIVIYYPAPVTGSNGMVQIRWNHQESCDLRSGGFIAREVSPGPEALAFSFCGIRGVSLFRLNAAAGRSYYLRVLPYDSSLRGIASGYPSEFDARGKPLMLGPLKIDEVSESEAFRDLKTMKPSRP